MLLGEAGKSRQSVDVSSDRLELRFWVRHQGGGYKDDMTYDLVRGDAEDYRAFAKKYIKQRLSEGERDAIEELSAYLGDWMHTRKLIKEITWDKQ